MPDLERLQGPSVALGATVVGVLGSRCRVNSRYTEEDAVGGRFRYSVLFS